jgi:hypothetical protein
MRAYIICGSSARPVLSPLSYITYGNITLILPKETNKSRKYDNDYSFKLKKEQIKEWDQTHDCRGTGPIRQRSESEFFGSYVRLEESQRR